MTFCGLRIPPQLWLFFSLKVGPVEMSPLRSRFFSRNDGGTNLALEEGVKQLIPNEYEHNNDV